MTKSKQAIAIVCLQWGDTGKGKFVDYFAADWADIIARGTGGANAGHTIRFGGNEHVFHLLPSGMLHKKLNIIGSGVAVEPLALINEIDALRREMIPIDNLRVALNARLVLPQHILLDKVKGKGIGTTGRGMGPVYADHVLRIGLIVNDMLNPDVFRKKLKGNLEAKEGLDVSVDALDQGEITEQYLAYGRALRPFVEDTDALLRAEHGRQNILLEGAQGNLLSVDYGTYPFVTSSDCSVQGLAKGVGLREQDVDVAYGIVKAFYMTRVGEGPFPTEFGGERSAKHCRGANRASEGAEFPNIALDDPDDFLRGIAIRRKGNEYGATTGRARRTGWLDLPLIRYSMRLTGPNVILTKLDVLDGVEHFDICSEYEYKGPDYVCGQRTLKKGDRLRTAIPDIEVMQYCEPRYRRLPGWKGPISNHRVFTDLPENLQQAVLMLQSETGVNVTHLSVGPDREETIRFLPEQRVR